MKLASVEVIRKVIPHSNADRLELVTIKNYQCIVPKGSFKVGDLCVFIQPDSVLPTDQSWAESYRKFAPKRVKATKIRNVWSFGLVIPLEELGRPPVSLGIDMTDALGITKWEEKVSSVRGSIGGLPYSIPKTDEDRWQNLDYIPYGEPIEVTLKIDGQSCTFFYKDGDFGVTSRSTRYDINVDNAFTRHISRYNIREKLERFCVDNKVNLAIRGESFGQGIQNKSHNPWSKVNPGFRVFSVYYIDEMRYARLDDPFYFPRLCEKIELDHVPIIERGTLTQSLINYYDEAEDWCGDPFEGVVINGRDFSFKIINKNYDSQ